MIEVRAAWVAAGLLGVVLHRPSSVTVWLAIGVPWALGMILLAGKGTSIRLARAWAEAISGPTGVFGAVGLGVVVLCVAVVVSVGAGVLLGLWVAAGLFVIGVRWGSAILRSQMAGWSLLALAAVVALFAAEAVLRLRPVAERLGTPAEIIDGRRATIDCRSATCWVYEMGRAAAERNVPIVLVLFPDFIPGIHDEADLPFRSIHDQVAQAASAAGFSILDLTPDYLRAGGDLRRWWATRYDARPNEAAARLAATSIADYVLTHFGDVAH